MKNRDEEGKKIDVDTLIAIGVVSSILVLIGLSIASAILFIDFLPKQRFNNSLSEGICEYQGWYIDIYPCPGVDRDCLAGFMLLSREMEDGVVINGNIHATKPWMSRSRVIQEIEGATRGLREGDHVVCFLTPDMQFVNKEDIKLFGLIASGIMALIGIVWGLYALVMWYLSRSPPIPVSREKKRD